MVIRVQLHFTYFNTDLKIERKEEKIPYKF